MLCYWWEQTVETHNKQTDLAQLQTDFLYMEEENILLTHDNMRLLNP